MVSAVLAFLSSLLAQPEVVGTVLASLVGVVVWFVRRLKSQKAQSNFDLGVRLASVLVHEIAIRTETKLDDHLDLFLQSLAGSMAAEGREMTPAEMEKAKVLFAAMAGAKS